MKTIRSISQMQKWSARIKRKGLSIGFVPTMGCLHEGHGSLIQRSIRENDHTIVSIFVNKLQFGPQEDFRRYPRPLRKDAGKLKAWGADVLFHPAQGDMYPADFATTVAARGLDATLCGLRRPGHFLGVATIVSKLLNIVGPTRAYFGQKDYQQLRIIEQLARDLNYPLRIVPCRTVRDAGGLALSSRNQYLTTHQKNNANNIYSTLQWGAKLIKSGSCSIASALRALTHRLAQIPDARVEYVEFVDARTLKPIRQAPRVTGLLACAVHLGPARLIDNIHIEP